jgi:hypothetical protein
LSQSQAGPALGIAAIVAIRFRPPEYVALFLPRDRSSSHLNHGHRGLFIAAIGQGVIGGRPPGQSRAAPVLAHAPSVAAGARGQRTLNEFEQGGQQ